MYQIEKTDFGVKLTFSGFIQKEEMEKWVKESESTLRSMPGKFSVLIDMRQLKPLPKDAEAEMQKGQKLFKDKGMQRSAVILSSSLTTMQFRRIAKETGIYEWERYFDASTEPNWEAASKDWLARSIDPDRK